MSILEGAEICEGLTKDEDANAMCEDPSPSGSSSLMRHTIPIARKHFEEDYVFIRSENCELLCDDILCSSCMKLEGSLSKMKESNAKRTVEPLKSNAPLFGSSKERLVATVQKRRMFARSLKVG